MSRSAQIALATPPALEGMVLVPREPTDEMVLAYWNSGADDGKAITLADIEPLACRPEVMAFWRDMLAASPVAAQAVTDARFGEQPMSLRERIGFMEMEHGSLRAVAAKTGVDVAYLSRLNSGEKTNPSDDTLRKLGLARRIGYAALQPHTAQGESNG